MKISGREFLSALSEYFSRQDFNNEIVLALIILPVFIISLWLLLYRKPSKSTKDSFDEIPEKEMELLKQISAQKGLSSFDRDFLIMLALDYNINPSKILLDYKTYEQIEKIMYEKAKKEGSENYDENLKNLKKIKYKLF